MTSTESFTVTQAATSKIDQCDFENLKFGKTFTDHMLICDYIDGEWQKAEIKPYAPFQIEPSSMVFHYGQAIFEGMKAFKDEADDVWLFRPEENYKRFNKSAVRMQMPEVPEEVFIDGLKKLIELDKAWVRRGNGSSLYIRPFMIANSSAIVASPSEDFRFMIILSPVRAYYSGEVKVMIAEHFSRAANGGIGAAKAAGNYAAQFYPTRLAKEQGYDQIIWTDDATHTKLEESGTMNVFFMLNGILVTAPVSERILDGVTRKSIIAIAKREGITVEERPITVDDLLEGIKNGTLTEIFGTGTAAVISPIAGFAYKEVYNELKKPAESVALQLKARLTNLQNKLEEDTFGWTVKV